MLVRLVADLGPRRRPSRGEIDFVGLHGSGCMGPGQHPVYSKCFDWASNSLFDSLSQTVVILEASQIAKETRARPVPRVVGRQCFYMILSGF